MSLSEPAAPTTAPRWTVAQLAKQVDVRPDTIRYYERAGLLPAAERTSGAHRRYGEDTAERLRFIRGAQRLGLRLRDIETLLTVRDTGSCPCEPADQLLRKRIEEIDEEMTRLITLRQELVRMTDGLADPAEACPDPSPGTWCPPSEGGEAMSISECDCNEQCSGTCSCACC